MKRNHPTTSADGAALAASIREVAREAHSLLNESSSVAHRARELARRVAFLEFQLLDQPENELRRWLRALHDRLQKAGAERSTPPCSLPTSSRRPVAALSR